ncbi:MAG TPA: hypothetical protein PLF40_14460 [Kofleriaceae bacterium]|nr:hypothetical protein [Kofleriaceae bacterium]
MSTLSWAQRQQQLATLAAEVSALLAHDALPATLPLLKQMLELDELNLYALRSRVIVLAKLQDFDALRLACQAVFTAVFSRDVPGGSANRAPLIETLEHAVYTWAQLALTTRASTAEQTVACHLLDVALDTGLNYYRTASAVPLRELRDELSRLLQPPAAPPISLYFFGPHAGLPRAEPLVLLAQFCNEAVARYNRAVFTKDIDYDQAYDATQFTTWARLDALQATGKILIVLAICQRDLMQLPEIGLLDNLVGNGGAHKAACIDLLAYLLDARLPFTETDVIAILRSPIWGGMDARLVTLAAVIVKKQGMSAELAAALRHKLEHTDTRAGKKIQKLLEGVR